MDGRKEAAIDAKELAKIEEEWRRVQTTVESLDHGYISTMVCSLSSEPLSSKDTVVFRQAKHTPVQAFSERLLTDALMQYHRHPVTNEDAKTKIDPRSKAILPDYQIIPVREIGVMVEEYEDTIVRRVYNPLTRLFPRMQQVLASAKENEHRAALDRERITEAKQQINTVSQELARVKNEVSELQRLRKEMAETQAQLTEVKRELTQARDQAAELQRGNKENERRFSESEQKAREAKQQADRELAQEKAQVEQLKKQLAENGLLIDMLRKDINEKDARLKTQDESAHSRETRMKSLRKELRQARSLADPRQFLQQIKQMVTDQQTAKAQEPNAQPSPSRLASAPPSFRDAAAATAANGSSAKMFKGRKRTSSSLHPAAASAAAPAIVQAEVVSEKTRNCWC